MGKDCLKILKKGAYYFILTFVAFVIIYEPYKNESFITRLQNSFGVAITIFFVYCFIGLLHYFYLSNLCNYKFRDINPDIVEQSDIIGKSFGRRHLVVTIKLLLKYLFQPKGYSVLCLCFVLKSKDSIAESIFVLLLTFVFVGLADGGLSFFKTKAELKKSNNIITEHLLRNYVLDNGCCYLTKHELIFVSVRLFGEPKCQLRINICDIDYVYNFSEDRNSRAGILVYKTDGNVEKLLLNDADEFYKLIDGLIVKTDIY